MLYVRTFGRSSVAAHGAHTETTLAHHGRHDKHDQRDPEHGVSYWPVLATLREKHPYREDEDDGVRSCAVVSEMVQRTLCVPMVPTAS